MSLAQAIVREADITTPLPLDDREFARFQRLILRETGIWLAPVKKALLVGRLTNRLRQLGLARFRDYYDLVLGNESELVEMLDRVCTNETSFFRDPRQFEFLRTVVIPQWRHAAEQGTRSRSLRIWSAACSSGEEPYSLAMLLHQELDALRPAWQIDILATDLSTRVLAKARAGIWTNEKAAGIPRSMLRKYMLRGVRAQAGNVKAAPEIQDMVRFARFNLMDETQAAERAFDAIFCRNVLIYFNAEG